MSSYIDTIDLWWYRAAPTRVVDGDTVVCTVDLGMFVRYHVALRVRGVDAPERFRGDPAERQAGAEAALFVEEWLLGHEDHGDAEFPLLINTHRDGRSFNRYVADIYCGMGHSLAQALVDAGHATVSEG